MNYYKRHIGDYAKKAGRLTMLEHGAYTLLLDACYDRERFPTLDEAIEWCWARTADEIAAVDFVISRFFRKDGEVYVQNTVLEELEKYQENSNINKEIAKKREESRRTNRASNSTDRAPTVNEAPPNHKPLTINQEPEEKKEATYKKTKSPSISLKTYILQCKELTVKAIPEDSLVFDYIEKIELPKDFLTLQWAYFKDRYFEAEAKRYTFKGWPGVFKKSVTGNWFKLWYADAVNGGYKLTTQGIQAQKAFEDKHGRG